jgi:hypothetical protein
MAAWSARDKAILSQAHRRLAVEPKGKLSSRCTHVKNHDSVKRS